MFSRTVRIFLGIGTALGFGTSHCVFFALGLGSGIEDGEAVFPGFRGFGTPGFRKSGIVNFPGVRIPPGIPGYCFFLFIKRRPGKSPEKKKSGKKKFGTSWPEAVSLAGWGQRELQGNLEFEAFVPSKDASSISPPCLASRCLSQTIVFPQHRNQCPKLGQHDSGSFPSRLFFFRLRKICFYDPLPN